MLARNLRTIANSLKSFKKTPALNHFSRLFIPNKTTPRIFSSVLSSYIKSILPTAVQHPKHLFFSTNHEIDFSLWTSIGSTELKKYIESLNTISDIFSKVEVIHLGQLDSDSRLLGLVTHPCNEQSPLKEWIVLYSKLILEFPEKVRLIQTQMEKMDDNRLAIFQPQHTTIAWKIELTARDGTVLTAYAVDSTQIGMDPKSVFTLSPDSPKPNF